MWEGKNKKQKQQIKKIAELEDVLNLWHSKKFCFLITKQKQKQKSNLFGKNKHLNADPDYFWRTYIVEY